MKLQMKLFYSTEPKRYRVLPVELRDDVQGLRYCANCSKFIYNRILKGPFCSHHRTPVNWYDICAYFEPIWNKKL